MDAESSQGEVQCLVCRRSFSLDIEVNDGFEAISICRECKMMFLNDNNGRSVGIRGIRRRRRQGRRSRFRSYESTEDSFSQRISYLINLASQSHEVDGDSSFVPRHRMTYNGTPSRSRRWRTTVSDNESDGADQMDSVFGESDSNVSFGGYGGDSDASLDRNSLLDRDMFIQVENESYIYTDTDIDPMHAGLDQWNSDDQDEEEEEWEEADFDETPGLMESHQQFQSSNASPSANGERESQDSGWLHWRMRGSQGVYYADIFADLEESETRPPFLGNPDDYVDSRRFEELLEQLAENDGSRRGAPPASASFVALLPSIVISQKHEKNGSLICPVCKDSLSINTEAKQLPCFHLYHPSCILPWLTTRNSCPVCRYELPTDDPEYEKAKRHMMNRGETYEIQQQNMADEISYAVANETEDEETHTISNTEIDEGRLEEVNQSVGRSNRWGSRNGWWFLASAPIVSLVGIMLVLWFRNTPCDRRRNCSFQEQMGQQHHISQNTEKKRWWSIF